MRGFRLSIQFAMFSMLFLFIACTSTKFPTLWKDETYQGPPTKIMVINAFPFPVTRRLFEDEFVKALKDYKVDAVVSYTIMPDPIVPDKGTIMAQAKKVGADTVLINKPFKVAQEETIDTGGPRYTDSADDLYINAQTDVYDIKSNRLVLSDTTVMWIRYDTPYATIINSYVKALVKKLSKQGLF